MGPFEICITIISSITLLLVLYLLFGKKEETKEDLKGDLDKASNDIKLQLVKDQGEIKEHLANKIGSNNEKMVVLYNEFSNGLVNTLNNFAIWGSDDAIFARSIVSKSALKSMFILCPPLSHN